MVILALTTPVALYVEDARGQSGDSFEPSTNTRPELPPFPPEQSAPGSVLPRLELPATGDTESATAGQRIRIDHIAFRGNTVLSDQDLQRVADPYRGRALSFADIQALRDGITLRYVERGYVTSGAIIGPQSLAAGRLEITIVEGVLERVEVDTPGRFRPSYFEQRLESERGRIVNVGALEERLQLLQSDDRVSRIASELAPGARRGEAILRLQVEEDEPRRLQLTVANDLSPAIGAEAVRLRFDHRNPLGLGDRFQATGATADGLKEFDTSYELPLGPYDTTLRVHFRQNRSQVVDDAFDALEIEGRSRNIGATIRHPVHHTLQSSLELFVSGEHSQSKSFLLGEGFSFSPGPIDGVSRVIALRLGGDWVDRRADRVLAVRSTVSVGLDVLGATRRTAGIPDGRFVSWLTQVQWARRFSLLDSQLIVRADLQLSDSPLLGIEQHVVGGASTVRGYRENARMRDNAMLGSLELRIPLPIDHLSLGDLAVAPFVDAGNAWNRDRPSSGPHTLIGVGAGLRWRYRDWLSARLYWGHDLRALARVGARDLQDSGVHFAFNAGGW